MRRPRLSSIRLRPVVSRGLVLVALVAGLIALGRSDTLHRELMDVLEAAKGVIARHPVAGPLAFIGLSAVSAMFAFVSSAILVPAAVYAWGPTYAALGLWLGWTLGGIAAHTIARYLGRPVLHWVVSGELLRRYAHLLDRQPKFSAVLLFQLALPSEIPGYLLGLARYPLHRYVGALMLAELPYAVGTVLLGVGFVERDTVTLVAVSVIGAAGLLLVAGLMRYRANRGDATK